MDQIAVFNAALDQARGIVKGVKADQMGDPTPCSEFDVKALLNHLTAAITAVSGAAKGGELDMSIFGQDLVGDDPSGAFDKAASAAKAAVTPDVLGQIVNMPFGAVPGAVAVSVATLEALQHGWDVAKATGQNAGMDPALSEAGIELAKQFPADLVRSPGVYGPEVECAADAPAHDRLAAFLGRVI
jgi:uncharacterized protein (TIGR03086 family)